MIEIKEFLPAGGAGLETGELELWLPVAAAAILAYCIHISNGFILGAAAPEKRKNLVSNVLSTEIRVDQALSLSRCWGFFEIGLSVN